MLIFVPVIWGLAEFKGIFERLFDVYMLCHFPAPFCDADDSQ